VAWLDITIRILQPGKYIDECLSWLWQYNASVNSQILLDKYSPENSVFIY